jgi:hypothetical protein
MIVMLALAAAASTPDLGDLSERLDACLITKTEAFAAANEAADVTVEAAFHACLPERADLRVGLQESLKADATLTSAQRRNVEQSSYDLAITSARGRALVRLVSKRAANAKN